MMRANKIVLFFIVMTLLMSNRQVLAADELTNDVKILIDVSGSMKKNDPNNLRTPALEMIVGLLPNQSKAGVWTFAKYVNMLIPHKDVNEKWRSDAKKQTGKIHSRGLFTDIEQVLNKATANQVNPDKTMRQNVILLSDGLVDISTDSAQSQASKKRILTKVIPRLKKANIAVHTIALSSSSDQALLREIALETDGWYEQVDTAEQLQQVFLHLFEKAAKRDTVPIKENTFKIDESVTEMTVLVFRQADAKATQLVQPDQTRLTSLSDNSTVKWLNSEAGYDLVTIVEPQVGEWAIEANIDPNNRVMILTDLKLITSDLPNNILIGETFDFDVNLSDKNEMITRDNFLALVDAQLKHENEISDSVDVDLNASLRKGNYRTQVGETFQPGRNDIVTTITSGTFERQRRQSINVVEMPFNITTERLTDEETRTHRISIEPDVSLIDTKKIAIAALLTAEDGSEWSYDVLKSADNAWVLTLAELEAEQKYKINLQIKGETSKGRALFLQPNEIILVDDTINRISDVPDLATELSSELALLDQEAGTALLETVSVDEEMGESEELELLDELEPLEGIDELDELSPLEQMDLIDELGGDLDELLPENDELELSGLEDELLEDESRSTEDISTSLLMIGNSIILLLAAVSFFIWRRKSKSNKNPGAQL